MVSTPDFSGVWTNASLTGLTRPPQIDGLVIDPDRRSISRAPISITYGRRRTKSSVIRTKQHPRCSSGCHRSATTTRTGWSPARAMVWLMARSVRPGSSIRPMGRFRSHPRPGRCSSNVARSVRRCRTGSAVGRRTVSAGFRRNRRTTDAQRAVQQLLSVPADARAIC